MDVVGGQMERGWETGENIVPIKVLWHGSAKVAGGRLIDKVGDRRGDSQRKEALGTRYERRMKQ